MPHFTDNCSDVSPYGMSQLGWDGLSLVVMHYLSFFVRRIFMNVNEGEFFQGWGVGFYSALLGEVQGDVSP